MKKLNNKNNITPFIQQQLQRVRKNQKLSEEAAAIRAGISLREYLAIEQGSRRISVEILAELALAFDTDVREFLPPMRVLKKVRSEK